MPNSDLYKKYELKSDLDFFMKKTCEENGGYYLDKSTSYYTAKEYINGHFIIMQFFVGGEIYDRELRFGPVKVKLSELMKDDKYFLLLEGSIQKSSQNLRLVDFEEFSESYTLARIRTVDRYARNNLALWIQKDYHNRLQSPSKKQLSFVEKDTDPLDTLKKMYPKKMKPVTYIGNQTLPEYVKQQLREKRRLR